VRPILESHPEEETMTARLIALLVTTALLGFLVGVRAIGSPTPAQTAAREVGLRESDPLRGGFWRPAGSDAARPTLRLEPTAWVPPESKPGRPQPDALAAVRAVVRLASLD
jgi:hypothetical protein